jgi:hypothetical protein
MLAGGRNLDEFAEIASGVMRPGIYGVDIIRGLCVLRT